MSILVDQETTFGELARLVSLLLVETASQAILLGSEALLHSFLLLTRMSR